VRKTTIVIDEDLVQRAQEALGTRGLKATVDKALQEAVALAARRRAIEQLRTMSGLELDNPEVMASAWR
jgi:Arc/MetJ family transcription regulator